MKPPFALLGALLFLPLLAPSCERDPVPVQDPEKAPAAALGPRVRLRLSGHLEGRLEPCGCASGQIGGLARRGFRNKQHREYDVLVEGGNLTVGGSPLDELKLLTILSALDDNDARYSAIGLGPGDFELPADLLAGFLEGFPQLTFLAADVVVDAEEDAGPTWPAQPFVEATTEQGAVVRIASLAFAVPTAVEGLAFRRLEPAAAWERAMQDVAPETFRVVLAHGSTAEAHALVDLEPRPDLVVVVNGAHQEPPREPDVQGGVPIVHPGVRGRFLLDVTLTRTADGPSIVRYETIQLEGSRTAKGALEDAKIRAMILDHRHAVKDADIRAEMAERFPAPGELEYVGSSKCMGCHFDAYRTWQASKHGHAFRTLEEAEAGDRYGWPVTYYPDCVSCHVVGYGEVSGFVSPEATPDLRGVGCEECHGPGQKHVTDPMKFRMGAVAEGKCTECHDFEQSPGFDYAERWKLIEHGK